MPSKRSCKGAEALNNSQKADRLRSLFHAEEKVLVVISADPDALASSLAFKRFLWRRVNSVTIARSNDISRPDNMAMVRMLNIPCEPLKSIDPQAFNSIVMLDSQPHHNSQFEGLPIKVIIDHHPLGNSLEKAEYVDIRPRYGATSTIMTQYLRAARIKPSTRLATALVFGIKNDTAGFQRPSLEDDVHAFQYLFPKANHSVLRKLEFSEMRVGDLKYLRLALDRAKFRRHRAFVHLGPVPNPDNLVQIADFLLKIDSVDQSVVSGCYQDKLVIIIRNAAFRANAGKIATQAFEHLGPAGGHKAMARAEITFAALGEALSGTDDETIARYIIRRIQWRSSGSVKPKK